MPSDGDHELGALLEAMLASSLDAVVTIDATGRIVTFNRAAEETFGFTAEEALGRDVAQVIIPPSLRDRHYRALASHLESGSRTIIDRRVELTGMRRDGSEFPIELTVTRVLLDGPPLFTAYLRDITERKQARDELLASRSRVVESADRERRRIERNLHDGAQQRLLTIGVLLSRLAMEPEAPQPLLDLVAVAQDETGKAIAELRELAQGIHPAALAEGGLATALRGLALVAAADVTVDVEDVRLPESVEVALYYVAAEALSNVVKHASASRVTLSLGVDGDTATLRVIDDGVGGIERDQGPGLAGLVDRIEAVGGSISIESAEGAGTAITVTAPAR